MTEPSTIETFKFQLVSDLHLESPPSYTHFTFPCTAPNLLLAGDIGNTRDLDFFTFLRTQLARYTRVFLVLGNHEPYHSSFPDAIAAVQLFSSSLPPPPSDTTTTTTTTTTGEFIFLNQTRYDVPGTLVTVLGCTLFSHIPDENSEDLFVGLQDFYQIGSWTIADHNAAHAGDLEWLNLNVALVSRERRVVVVSHHGPSRRREVNNPAHEGSRLTTGFVTELGAEMCWRGLKARKAVVGEEGEGDGGKRGTGAFWGFGHTHWNCDEVLDAAGEGKVGGDGVRVVANQRGYYFRGSEGFEAGRVYEI